MAQGKGSPGWLAATAPQAKAHIGANQVTGFRISRTAPALGAGAVDDFRVTGGARTVSETADTSSGAFGAAARERFWGVLRLRRDTK